MSIDLNQNKSTFCWLQRSWDWSVAIGLQNYEKFVNFESKKMFLCPHCKVKTRLKSRYAYVKHIDSHNLKKKVYPCPLCNIPFQNRTSFYQHMNSSHEKTEPDSEKLEILCRHCNDFFPSIEDVEKHLEELVPRIPCPFCRSKPSPTMNAYRVHKHRWVKLTQLDQLLTKHQISNFRTSFLNA